MVSFFFWLLSNKVGEIGDATLLFAIFIQGTPKFRWTPYTIMVVGFS